MHGRQREDDGHDDGRRGEHHRWNPQAQGAQDIPDLRREHHQEVGRQGRGGRPHGTQAGEDHCQGPLQQALRSHH